LVEKIRVEKIRVEKRAVRIEPVDKRQLKLNGR